MSITITRNPNLTKPNPLPNTIHILKEQFPDNPPKQMTQTMWWTGLPPELCPGFDNEKKYLVALPQINLQNSTRLQILDYFNNSWTLTELLFRGLKNEHAYIRPPYHELRHPMIFYYGHPAVLFVNKMRLSGLLKEPINLYLEKVLETGVDEMSWDDLSKNEKAWPSVSEVRQYRKIVYDLIINIIQTHPDLESSKSLLQDSPLWAIWMGIEHEKIHFETSSVLIRELPIDFVETPQYWAPLHPSLSSSQNILTKTSADILGQQNKSESLIKSQMHSKDYSISNPWVSEKGTTVKVGKSFDVPYFGWDNEYGHRSVSINDFEYTQKMISNLEFFEFVQSGHYVLDQYWSQEGLHWRKFRNTKRPTFWAATGPEGAHQYELRTIFEYVQMPWDWPVEVNYHEAQAYCRWKNKKDNSQKHYRLLTEAEYKSIWFKNKNHQDLNQMIDYYNDYQQTANVNFHYSSPGSADEKINGNVWHWIEDQFNPLESFKTNYLYDDFSTPCFDGKHQMILGGSFISCGHEASPWSRFHFRPHFYQHSGFRMAFSVDGSKDNGAVRINTQNENEYVHPRRNNVLDQIHQKDWWKSAIALDQPLQMNILEIQKSLKIITDFLVQFEKQFSDLAPQGMAHDAETNDVKKNFQWTYQASKNFPQNSQDLQNNLEIVFKEMAPLGQWPGHPGYAAYVAGSGNWLSSFGQMISMILNPYSSHFNMAPGLVHLELETLGWFKNLFGYPMNAGGFFTSGSSLASLSALTFARNKFINSASNSTQGLGHLNSKYDFSKMTMYISKQGHHSIAKAWAYLGFDPMNVRWIDVDAKSLSMNIDSLKNQIETDIQAGLQPICIVGTAGSTNTGSVDDLKKIASVSDLSDPIWNQKFKTNGLPSVTSKIWFHVDGAYGAAFALTEYGQQKLNGLSLSDSISFDLHKSFAAPYGTGALLVKNATDMKINYLSQQNYMPPSSMNTFNSAENEADFSASARLSAEYGPLDFADITPELSRDYRGLRVWLPFKTLGIQPFILNLEEKLKLTEWLKNQLKTFEELRLVCEPDLTILAFYVKDQNQINSNEKTSMLLTKINSSDEFFASSTMIENQKVIRICLLAYRLHFDRIEKLISIIRKYFIR